MNLGHFSEGSSVFRSALTASALPIRGIARLAISSGLIGTLDAAPRDAGNMPIAIPANDAALIHRAATILQRRSITDEDVAKWIDHLGAVLRRHRLFFLGSPLLFATNEEDFDQVDLSFAVDVNAAQAAVLNMELPNAVSSKRCFHPSVFHSALDPNVDSMSVSPRDLLREARDIAQREDSEAARRSAIPIQTRSIASKEVDRYRASASKAETLACNG